MRKRIQAILILFLFAIFLNAQESIVFSKKQANQFFKKEEYDKSAEAYAQLIKEDNTNLKFNYRLGVSLFNSAENKAESIPYLKYVSENLSPKKQINVRFLLANAYHLNHDFENAIKEFENLKASKYKKLLIGKDLNLLIAQCKTASEMVKNSQHIYVLEIKSINKQELIKRQPFMFENSDTNNRKMYIKPLVLRTLEEAKFNDKLLVLQIKNGKAYYYPEYKYNKYGRLEKDIVYEVKTPKDDFPERMDVGPLINSNYDENFPYLHTDNKTLYFVSNGPESMGGYDIFKSELDSSTGFWGLPQNLGFPINSVYDDYLYLPNQENKHVYFLSNRFQKNNQLGLYKILPPKNYSNDVLFKVNKTVKSNTAKQIKRIKKIVIKENNDNLYSLEYSGNTNDNFFMISLPELTAFDVEIIFLDGSKENIEWFTPLKSRCSEINQIDFYQNNTQFEFGIDENSTSVSNNDKNKIYLEISQLKSNTILNTKSIETDTTAKLVFIADSLSLSSCEKYLSKITREKINLEKKISTYIWLAEKRKNASALLLQDFENLKSIKSENKNNLTKEEELKLNESLQIAAKKIEYNFNEIVIAMSNVIVERELTQELKDHIKKLKNYISINKIQNAKNVSSISTFNELKSEQKKLDYKITLKDSVELKLKQRILAIKNQDSLLLNENIKRRSKIGFLLDEKNYLTDELNNAWGKKKKAVLKREIDLIDKKLLAISKRQQKIDKKNKLKIESQEKELDIDFLSSWFTVNKPMEFIEKPDNAHEKFNFDHLAINQFLSTWVSKNTYDWEKLNSKIFFDSIPFLNFNDAILEKATTKKQNSIEYNDVAMLKQIKILPEIISENQNLSIQNTNKQDSLIINQNKSFALKIHKGQTMYSLARKYKLSIQKIKQFNEKSNINPKGIDWTSPKRNGLYKDWIYVGDNILIPSR